MRGRELVTSDIPFLFLAALAIALAYWNVAHGLVLDWLHDENNSHGFLVPLVSAFLIWRRRDALARQPVSSSLAGLAIACLGTMMLLFGWFSTEYYTQRLSLIVVLSGCTIYWYGWNIFSVLLAPLAYLILMIPIPAIIYDAIAFPLKLFVAKVSVTVMKAMGILVVREGNIMAFPNITLEVVNACSGLRSLTSLLAIGLAYTMLFVHVRCQKWLIFFLIFPIALVSNMVRVIGTGILAQYFGPAAAEGFFHEFAGIVVFFSSLAMLLFAHHIISKVIR